MRPRLRPYLIKGLALKKLYPTIMAKREEIVALLNKLHPRSTDKALIRLGPKSDGGYLLPDDLDGISACFSPGVNDVSGFERGCADRGMKVFLADRSVDGPAEKHELFHFSKMFIGAMSNDEFMTLDQWVADAKLDPNSDLLLQIDIEGYEYEVFLSASETLMKRFRIIVAEFHALDQFWSKPFFNIASRALEKILQTHTCVHIHPNNCCGTVIHAGLDLPRALEFTFLRSDRIGHSSYQTKFPHPLDSDNTPNPPLPLAPCWFHAE